MHTILYMTASYPFFNNHCILICETSFSNWWGHSKLPTSKCNYIKVSILCSIYSPNKPLWKIHGIVSVNSDCFTIDKSNKVKIIYEIMSGQGYFFKKIALETKLCIRSFFLMRIFLYLDWIPKFIWWILYSVQVQENTDQKKKQNTQTFRNIFLQLKNS